MSYQHGLHVEHSGIDESDPELITKYLNQAYAARFSIEHGDLSNDPISCSHSRVDVGKFAIEEIRHRGDIRLQAEHVTSVIAVAALDGRVECHCCGLTGSAGPGEWVLASTGTGGVRLHAADARLRSVVVDRSLLAEVAAAGFDEPSSPVVRFTGLTPSSPAMNHLLDAASRFVSDMLSTAEAARSPLLLGEAGRMLATAILSAFPNELPLDDLDDPSQDDHPTLLRHAVEFIQDNAARDIGVVDVATAVYLTPRAVQYMFRRHLDSTPTAFLREVRLKRAHEELLASERGDTTVAAVAARWGFAHTGRFAVLHRQIYGESPHETLRR